MPEEQPAQAQAAQPEQTAITPLSVMEQIEQIATAQLTGVSPSGDIASVIASTPEPAEPQTPAVEPKEQPAPTEEPPVTEPAPAEPAEPANPEEDVSSTTPPPEEEPETYDRIRLGGYKDQDKAMANAVHILVKSGMPYEEAVRRIVGIQQPETQPEPEPEPEIPVEITTLEARAADLKAKLKAKGAEAGTFDEEVADLTMELSEVNAELSAERRAFKVQRESKPEDVRREVDDAVFEVERNKVVASVPKEFPDMADRESLQHMIAVALGKEIADNPNHPLHGAMLGVDAPLILAREAAKRVEAKGGKVTRIGKPVVPSTPPAKPTASSPASQPAKPGPAPGSRTTAPQVTVTPQDALKAIEEDTMNVLMGRGSKLTPHKQPNTTYVRA